MRVEEPQVDEQWEQSGLIGKLLGDKYMVVRELSHTARGDVFEAELLERGQRFAVKVLRASHPASNALRSYVDDKRSITLVGHPHIVDVVDIGRHVTGEPFVACELVRGESLRALAAARPFEQRRALQIMRQVVEALRAAHELGIAHRSLDPTHIMIARGDRDADQVKVLGFGLARLVTARAETFADPAYIAPEHVVGANSDRRADLYSAGAILFELLTGHAPFHAKGASALMRLHAYAPVQTLKQRAPGKSFTAETEALIARALEKRPDERFQTAAEMLTAIDGAIDSVAAVEASLATISPVARGSDPKPDDSLLLLARDLMPSSTDASVGEPIIPQNVERHVPELPWWMRAGKVIRRVSATVRRLVARAVAAFRRLDRRQQAIVGGAGVVLMTIVIVLIARGGSDAPPASAAVAQPVESDEPAAAPVDDVATWSRELEQSKSCKDRRELIAKLAAAGDARAIPSLRKARASKCVAREANKAIAKLERAR